MHKDQTLKKYIQIKIKHKELSNKKTIQRGV